MLWKLLVGYLAIGAAVLIIEWSYVTIYFGLKYGIDVTMKAMEKDLREDGIEEPFGNGVTLTKEAIEGIILTIMFWPITITKAVDNVKNLQRICEEISER